MCASSKCITTASGIHTADWCTYEYGEVRTVYEIYIYIQRLQRQNHKYQKELYRLLSKRQSSTQLTPVQTDTL